MKIALLFLAAIIVAPVGSIQGQGETEQPALPTRDDSLDFVPWQYRGMIKEAAHEAGISPQILAGIAYAESSFRENPNHPDRYDRGMFGLHETPEIHAERARKWGEYDALVPEEAVRIAAGYLAECYGRLGDETLAICAYRQGVEGIRRDGPEEWYAERVKGVAND